MATRDDADGVRAVHLSAFPQGEGTLVSKLAVDLLSEATHPPILSWLAEADDSVVGHVAFSPVTMRGTKKLLGYMLAPLAVCPGYQRRGIGSQLVKNGIERLSGPGPGILLVYGDPAYYGRFGFRADAAGCHVPPYKLQHPFGWLGMALGGCRANRSAVNISCVSCFSNPALW